MLSYFGKTSITCVFTLQKERPTKRPKNASVISGVSALQMGRLVCFTALLLQQWVVSPLSSVILCPEWSFLLPQSCHALCLHQQGLPEAWPVCCTLLMLHTILLHFPSSYFPKGKVTLGSKSLETWQGHTSRLDLQEAPWNGNSAISTWPWCSFGYALTSFLLILHVTSRWVEWTASPPLWI